MDKRDEIREQVMEIFRTFRGSAECQVMEPCKFYLPLWDATVTGDDVKAVADAIVKDRFDMAGFSIFEISHPRVFTFFNEEKRQFFDMTVDPEDKETWVPAYIKPLGENTVRMYKAQTIPEAIANYEWPKGNIPQ